MLTSEEMAGHAEEAAEVLKSIANPNRLMILCSLIEGEMTVSAINDQVPLSQSALSQHLARLRAENLVTSRKEGQTVHYRISDPRIVDLMSRLYELYCAPQSED
jgi:DNA-binding transcriptional ArsR family regulator